MSKQIPNPAYYITSASTIASGGVGYTVGDILTLTGGTYATQARVTVTGVFAGAITAFSITVPGSYTVTPAIPVPVTGGTGNGATIRAAFLAANPGFTPILLYGSNTAGTTAPNGTLGNKELFVNTTDQTVFVGNNLGQQIQLVDTLAAQKYSNVSITGGKINLPGFAPTDLADVATVAYVQSYLVKNVLAPCVACTTVDLGINWPNIGLPIIDGYQTIEGDRILVRNQGDMVVLPNTNNNTQNGIYNATANVAGWTRAVDADTGAELASAIVYISGGMTQAGLTFREVTPAPVTIGTSPIIWNVITSSATVPIDATTGLFYNAAQKLSFVLPGAVNLPSGSPYNLLQAVDQGDGTTLWTSRRAINTPTLSSDPATKGYVDTALAGQNLKTPVSYATTSSLTGIGLYSYQNGAAGVGATLTGQVNTPLVVDGINQTAVGTRILVKADGNTAISTFVLDNGGSGWAVGDKLRLNGGSFTAAGHAAIFQVASVSGNAVTALTLFDAGLYDTTSPSLGTVLTTTAVAPATGTGVTVTINSLISSNFVNGIYALTQLQTATLPVVLTRATDSNTWASIYQSQVSVTSGVSLNGSSFTANVPSSGTIGTTPINYVASSGNTLPVPRGGTGNSTFAKGAVLFGNNAAAIDTDSVGLYFDNASNLLGINTGSPVANLHVAGTTRIAAAFELVNSVSSPLTGPTDIFAASGAVWYFTVAATGNFQFNFRGSATQTLEAYVPLGHTITFGITTTQGATAYYHSPVTVLVDGVSAGVTGKWQGPVAPSYGSANGNDSYIVNLTHTATNTWYFLASKTQFGG